MEPLHPEPSSVPLPAPHLGARVRHLDGYCGTLRYAGALLHVPPNGNQQACWFGVEWDTDGHGKHDGTVQGVRYFSCPPGRGSLLKPDRVKLSMSLFEALVQRYTEDCTMEELAARGRRCTTHGADPFVRDSLTGAFPNVKQTDCQANFDLSCVGFGDDELPGLSAGNVVAARPWKVWDPKHNAAQFRVATTNGATQLGSTPPDAPTGGLLGTSPQKLRRFSEVCDEARDDPDAVEYLKETLLPQQPFVGSMSAWFPKLTVLVLKGTLVNSWHSVVYIMQNLPSLSSLNVSDTHLGTLSLSSDADLLLFTPTAITGWSTTLTTLSASHIGGDLMTLSLLLGCLPSLCEVNFSRNHLGSTDLQQFHAVWASIGNVELKQRAYHVGWNVLERLHLEKSGITEVGFLQQWFEHLQCQQEEEVPEPKTSTALLHLNLSDNGIRSLAIRPSSNTVFSQTTSLWMRGAKFPSWDACALDLIPTFPSLSDLIFTDDDLLDSTLPQVSDNHNRTAPTDEGMPNYGSRFDQGTLERFRYMTGAFPKQIQRLNNSTLTEREWAAAERMALHLYLKPYMEFLDNTEANPARAHPTPKDIGNNVPTNILLLVKNHVKEQEKGGGVKVFIPKPRFKRDDYAVHVVYTSISFNDMCEMRLNKGFESLVLEHMAAQGKRPVPLDISALHEQQANGATKDPRKSVIDVRWTVQRLRQHVIEHIGLQDEAVDPLLNFAHDEDHWTAAEQALIALSLPAHTDEAKERRTKLLARLPVSLQRLFPQGSVIMFHYDMELAMNDGAKEKGLHCKHLVRPADKLYEHRIADGDAIVVISFS